MLCHYCDAFVESYLCEVLSLLALWAALSISVVVLSIVAFPDARITCFSDSAPIRAGFVAPCVLSGRHL